MALPNFQAAGTKAEGSTSCSPGWPTHQAGDVALLFVEVRFGVDDMPDPSGDGWAPVQNSPQMFVGGGTVSTALAVFWKRAASASETGPTLASANHIVAQILTFRGCIATGDPWEAGAGDGDSLATASTSVAIPGGETTVDDCLIVAAVGMGQDTDTEQFSSWANADLANVLERADSFTAIGNGGGFGVATGELATAGTFGATTATSASSFAQARISLALLPAEEAGAFELDAQPGSYAVTGSAASPLAGRMVNAAAGAYAVTGAAATPLAARVVSALPGAYTVTGSAAGTLADRMLNASAGSYTITGADAEFVYTPVGGVFELNAEPGAYTVTGVAASPVAGRLFVASPGSYAIAGAQAGVAAGRAVNAAAGSYTVTGAAAGLLAARMLSAATGTYTVAGAVAGLDYSAAEGPPQGRTGSTPVSGRTLSTSSSGRTRTGATSGQTTAGEG